MSTKGIGEQGSAIGMSGRTGRWSVLVVAFLGILLGAATGLHAQGVRYDNIVLGPRGGPVASATVAVCSAAATTSATPCSPLATIYSDEALQQPMANPFQADSLGNYGFWAAPGHYVVQIYGTGVTTRVMNVFLPCDPSNCSMSNATFSSITAGTLNLTGNLTVNGRSVATEPKAGDAVMYVSPNGNDSADGLSWGSAKQTLYAAVSAIESTAMNSGANGGTIYVASDAACGGPISGQGLWLTGSSSPSSGWIHIPSALNIVGVGSTRWGFNAQAPQVALNCGSSTEPALQVESSSVPMHFANLIFTGSIPLYIDGSTSLSFDNDSFTVNDSVATNGPGVLIGANSFWLYFRYCVFHANDNGSVTHDGSDATEAFVVNPGGNSDDTQIYIFQSVAGYGSVVDHSYNGSWGITIDGLITENQSDGHGAIWFPLDGTNTAVSGAGTAYLNGIGVADANVTTPAVEVDGDGSPSTVVVVASGGHLENVVGPATIVGGFTQDWQDLTDTPPVEGQEGIIHDRLYAVNEIGASLFAPIGIGYSNEAVQLPSAWVKNYGTALTTTTAPDGTDNAGAIPASTGYYFAPSYSSSSHTVTSGDMIVGGVWFRNATTGTASGAPIQLGMGGCTVTWKHLIPTGAQYIGGGLKNGTSGQWTWWPFAIEFTSGASGCYPSFQGTVPSGQTGDFFAPYYHYFAAGTITESEAARIALNLAPYPDSVSPPVEATLRGHPFAFGGSGDNYFATLDHTGLTANRTYDFPDASGTIALTGAGGTSAGTITLSSGSGSHTFATPYAAAPVCTAADTTSTAAVKVASSATAVSVSGTGSDVVAWVCAPATN